MDKEGKPEAEIRVRVGESEFVLGQEVTVVRSNGEVEKDWTFYGYKRDGILYVRKGEGTDTLEKEVSVDRFLEWQER